MLDDKRGLLCVHDKPTDNLGPVKRPQSQSEPIGCRGNRGNHNVLRIVLRIVALRLWFVSLRLWLYRLYMYIYSRSDTLLGVQVRGGLINKVDIGRHTQGQCDSNPLELTT